MNWKWFSSILLIALASLGASLERSHAPNQEIEIQFASPVITSLQTQQTIAEVREKLLSIGIDEIQVTQVQEGKLVISYYSVLDVAMVKGLFSEVGKKSFESHFSNAIPGSSPPPFQKDSTAYKILIGKIQPEGSHGLGQKGILAEVKSAHDQYLNSLGYFSFIQNNVLFSRWELKTNQKGNLSNIFFAEVNSHKIPEVRAGPLS